MIAGAIITALSISMGIGIFIGVKLTLLFREINNDNSLEAFNSHQQD